MRSEAGYERQATRAEEWDALSLRRFYGLLNLGQFVRLLEYEKDHRGAELPEELQDLPTRTARGEHNPSGPSRGRCVSRPAAVVPARRTS